MAKRIEECPDGCDHDKRMAAGWGPGVRNEWCANAGACLDKFYSEEKMMGEREVTMAAENSDFDNLVNEVLAVQDARTAYLENRLRRALADSFEEARKKKDMSVRQLAKEMETSVSQVQRLLQRDVGGSVTLRTVCRAADVLGLAISVHAREKQPQGAR